MGNPVKIALTDLAYDFPLYARTCLKIVNKDGHRVPFEQNFAQRKVQAAIDECRARSRPPRIIELKARQVGMSTDAEARLFHACHLRADRQAIVMAHTSESARLIFRMTKRFLTLLPKTARPETAYSTKTEIEFKHNGSRLGVEVAKEGGGRGLTAQYVHLSEFSRYPKPDDTLQAVLKSVPSTMDSLVIIESTAKGFNAFYDLWVQAESGHSDFVPVFIPWFDEPGYRMPAKPGLIESLTEEEKQLMGKHGLSLEQLAWRRWSIRNECKNDENLFRQECPATPKEAFLMSGRPVFAREAMAFHQQFVPPAIEISTLRKTVDIRWDMDDGKPKLTEPFEGAPLFILEDPRPRHLYIVGTDPSEGDPGSDPSPHCVLNRMSLEPIALWWGRLRPDLLAQKGRALCVLYNRAHHIWESNNHGLAYQIAIEPLWTDVYLRETSLESTAKRVTDKPGFNTNTKSKSFMWDCLRRVVDDRSVQIRIPQIVKEMEHVYYDDKDVVVNYDGKPKDSLVAYALTLEAHRGSYENDLRPLDESDLEELREAGWDRDVARISRSMGLEAGAPASAALSRIGVTAGELEDLDEQDYARARRARMLGFEESA